MMYQLNSIILEGEILSEVVPCDTGGVFKIRSSREHDVEMNIEVKTGRLCDTCSEYLKLGGNVRVVGRLVQYNHGDWVPNETRLLAEHVEFKHVPQEKSETPG